MELKKIFFNFRSIANKFDSTTNRHPFFEVYNTGDKIIRDLCLYVLFNKLTNAKIFLTVTKKTFNNNIHGILYDENYVFKISFNYFFHLSSISDDLWWTRKGHWKQLKRCLSKICLIIFLQETMLFDNNVIINKHLKEMHIIHYCNVRQKNLKMFLWSKHLLFRCQNL